MKKLFAFVVAAATCLAGTFFLLTQKLGCNAGLGGAAANIDAGGKEDSDAGRLPAPSTKPAPPPSRAPAKPLVVTIDNDTYRVDDTSVDSIEEIVKLALAVPAEVQPPRVRVVRKPTARFLAEKKLTDALQAAKVDFVVE